MAAPIAPFELDQRWRTLSLVQREFEYSPSRVAKDFLGCLSQYEQRSNCVYQRGVLRLPYGSHSDEYILVADQGLSAQDAMLVFIHGGYWQALTAMESMFSADPLNSLGMAWAAPNYSLAPFARIDDQIGQCERAILHLITAYPQRPLVLAGSSAGAYLVAMVLQRPAIFNQLMNVRAKIKCALLLSGVFDLEPLVGTYINEALGLTTAQAQALSPMLRIENMAQVPIALFYGEQETGEFKRQSHQMAQALTQNGCNVQCQSISACDHFDIVFELGIGQSLPMNFIRASL
jgi:arylformamidase